MAIFLPKAFASSSLCYLQASLPFPRSHRSAASKIAPQISCERPPVLLSSSPTLRPSFQDKHILRSFSTTSQLQASETQEKEASLIDEITNELSHYTSLIDREGSSTDAIFETLNLVDLIERLGIRRHFTPQIQKILQTVYLQWNEATGFKDANATVLAFRLLRLHGYSVSACVLKNLNDDNGCFSSLSIQSPSQITTTINLYKCSQVGFPGESSVMHAIGRFARSELSRVLMEGGPNLLETNNQKIEIKFALDNPRQVLLPVLESRSIIRQLWPGNKTCRKYLELAKLDIEMLQELYQQEMKDLESWWTNKNFDELKHTRKRLGKILFLVASGVYEPKFSTYRVEFAKGATLVTVLDDIFDDKRYNLEQLGHFYEAIERWDPSLVDDTHLKISFLGLYNTAIELAAEASKIQGYDVLPFIRHEWTQLAQSFLKEAEWIQNQHIPSFNEYMKYGSVSFGLNAMWSSIFFMGEHITDEMLSYIGPESRLMYLVGSVGRLGNDLTGFDKESREGKLATGVGCYMRDHPECSQEEAIASVKQIIESYCQEIEWELCNCAAVVPECLRHAILNMDQSTLFTYKTIDGFTKNSSEFQQHYQDFFWGSFE